LEHALVGVTRD